MTVTPLMLAWTRYASDVLEQPALELTPEMVAFMAGAGSTLRAILSAGTDDVTELVRQMNTDIQDFADFMIDQHQEAAE